MVCPHGRWPKYPSQGDGMKVATGAAKRNPWKAPAIRCASCRDAVKAHSALRLLPAASALGPCEPPASVCSMQWCEPPCERLLHAMDPGFPRWARTVTVAHRLRRPAMDETVPHRGTLWVGASFCSIGGRATTLKPSCVFNNLRSCFFLGMSRHPERTGPRTLFSFRGPRRQVFVCGVEVGGGESKDLRLHFGIYATNFTGRPTSRHFSHRSILS